MRKCEEREKYKKTWKTILLKKWGEKVRERETKEDEHMVTWREPVLLENSACASEMTKSQQN